MSDVGELKKSIHTLVYMMNDMYAGMYHGTISDTNAVILQAVDVIRRCGDDSLLYEGEYRRLSFNDANDAFIRSLERANGRNDVGQEISQNDYAMEFYALLISTYVYAMADINVMNFSKYFAVS